MSIQFSALVASRAHAIGDSFSAHSLDLGELGQAASPVLVLDDFRVRGHPFGPHPHAGFSAVTYVFEDSRSGVRSRDSLGNDIVVRPGGIVWTQAARGVMHDELPAERGRELHGLQIFVNLSARNKLAAPQVLWLENSEVPEWRSRTGDRVRVAVGSFERLSSPLVPAEPFDLLDMDLRREVAFDLRDGRNILVYVVDGEVLVTDGAEQRKVAGGHALALFGAGSPVTFRAVQPAHFVALSGAEIREPVFAQGPFIMNDRSQVEEVIARYRAGQMGRLESLS